MGELCWLANRYVLANLQDHMILVRWLLVMGVIAIVAAVYFFLCYILGVSEARDCLGMILRRVPGLKRFAPRSGK
jgi:hypothetical protein